MENLTYTNSQKKNAGGIVWYYSESVLKTCVHEEFNMYANSYMFNINIHAKEICICSHTYEYIYSQIHVYTHTRSCLTVIFLFTYTYMHMYVPEVVDGTAHFETSPPLPLLLAIPYSFLAFPYQSLFSSLLCALIEFAFVCYVSSCTRMRTHIHRYVETETEIDQRTLQETDKKRETDCGNGLDRFALF